jgi:type II secretory pathway component PulF
MAKWQELHNSVVDGLSLAAAMAKVPDVFRPSRSPCVEAGETADSSTWCLNQIADFQRAKRAALQSLKRHAVPVHSADACRRRLIFLLVFFIPNFEKLFAGSAARFRCSPG